MADRACGNSLNQQCVAVTVGKELAYVQIIAAGFTLGPQFLTSAGEEGDTAFGYGLVINRIRGSLGAEWKISKQHAFDFFLLTDYYYDKNIDTNASGTTLKSLTWDQGINVSLGVGYKFSF